MSTVGILGGIGPESTIEYYRLIIKAYRQRRNDGSYPSILINSIDMTKMLDKIASKHLIEAAEYLISETNRLAAAGANFGVLASNTPHIVFDEIRQKSAIPLISIVEATFETVQALGVKRVGLFGTRFTMQGQFYPKVFAKADIEIQAPDRAEQDYIHTKYMEELVNGIILDETRKELIRIARRMKDDKGIQALILGGTELPLILRNIDDIGIPMLDTTQIHVEKIVDNLLS